MIEGTGKLPKQGQLVRVFPKEADACVARYFGVTYHSVQGDSHKWQQFDIRHWLPIAE